MNATPYIEALGKETGMDITLSASGAAALSLGGRNLLIQWIEATHSFIVYVEVGALGGWRNGEICRLLLASNFLLADTQGGALSYNDATGMVGLNFPILWARHRGFPQNRQQHRPVLGNMESPPRRHEQRTGSPYGTGAASRPRRRGSPGAVFHRRAIPPRLERFRNAPTPESPVRRNMACIQPKTILMQESHKTARISKVTALGFVPDTASCFSYRRPYACFPSAVLQ